MPVFRVSGDPVQASRDELESFMEYLSQALDMENFLEISIRFCSQDEIRSLNAEYRGKDEPTDILSFHLPGPLSGQDMGDLYLCAEEFQDQFALNSPRKLLFFLISHGFLHLLGWTHETRDKFEFMMAKQMDLVEKFLKPETGSFS